MELKRQRKRQRLGRKPLGLGAAVAWAAMLRPDWALGCATCMGTPESPLTQGLNWGIFSLLLTVMFVLSGAGAFFVYLARRASAFEFEERQGRSEAGPAEYRGSKS